MIERPTPSILRNRGVPVEAYVLTDDGDRLKTDSHEPKMETRWVRFDANAVADLEDTFGSLEGFEQACRETPWRAVRSALAASWNLTPRQAGTAMVDGALGDYTTAVGVGLAIANGVDPTQAIKLLETGIRAAEGMAKERERLLNEMIDDSGDQETESPGTSGSATGSALDVPTTSSGV